MNFRQIEAFRSTIEAGSVTAAAGVLNLSQRSVSRHLAELERSLGFKLFRRYRGRFLPTQEALLFVEEVDRCYVGLDTLSRAAEEIRDLSRGQVRIASIGAFFFDAIPDAIERFKSSYPDVTFFMRQRTPDRIAQWVSTRQVDLGLLWDSQPFPGVTFVKRFQFNFVCVLPKTHPLMDRESITVSNIKNESVVSLEKAFLPQNTLGKRLEEVIKRNSRIETQAGFSACSIVARGHGIAIVDPFTALHFKHGFDLGVRTLDMAVPYNIMIIEPKLTWPSLVCDKFVELLIDAIEDLANRYSFFQTL